MISDSVLICIPLISNDGKNLSLGLLISVFLDEVSMRLFCAFKKWVSFPIVVEVFKKYFY